MGALIFKIALTIIGIGFGVGEIVTNSIDLAETWQEAKTKKKESENTEEESE